MKKILVYILCFSFSAMSNNSCPKLDEVYECDNQAQGISNTLLYIKIDSSSKTSTLKMNEAFLGQDLTNFEIEEGINYFKLDFKEHNYTWGYELETEETLSFDMSYVAGCKDQKINISTKNESSNSSAYVYSITKDGNLLIEYLSLIHDEPSSFLTCKKTR